MDKYRITDESMEYNGHKLWRIECLRTHKKGGWIQNETNLSQVGEAWIADNAKVYGEASISDNAKVSGNAEVFGAAKITADAQVYDNAIVSDYAVVTAYAQVYDHATVEDSAQIYGHATVSGHALVAAYAQVYDYASIEGCAQVYDNVQIYGHAKVKDYAHIFKEARIKGQTVVLNNDRVSENLYNWEDINELSFLQISDVHNTKTVQLYANGRHQVAVKVSFEAKDRNKNTIKIAAKEIFENIEFVDEENRPIQNGITYTDTPSIYVYPLPDKTRINNKDTKSTALFYFSIDRVVNVFKLCVRCKIKQWSIANGMEKIKRIEYATTIENNNDLMQEDFLTVQVVPKRQFTQSNLAVQIFTEVDVNGIPNSILTKYYVQFDPLDGTITRQASCIEKNWFHYRQMGIYKGCSVSTDSSFVKNENALFTMKFEYTSSKYKVITSKNHEADGLCFWVYQLWEGLLWSYYEGGGEMYFLLYDQYGNEANLKAQVAEDGQLNFHVRLPELNQE